ncbi:hypothetical protein JH25_24860 [Pseudomonas sp. BRG-100]|jgi:hypothetical protein|uniref:hypothetical protein n=1 Tax=Pseudomonas TaxID=286 RepID=UPI0004E6CBCD|nr:MULTISPECIES: hypothetical protein [Pseudomonas]KFF46919.1 hypothetical protein JH25_24860 [Pseudomonas sp. BRG-100]MCK3851445.1 hypothetical protein [Pseudomonas sp. W2Jun17]WPN50677.1 hypothetical protein QMK52_17390 [Pseudomonas sp. P9_2]
MSPFLVYTIVWLAGSGVVLGLIVFAEYAKLDELESYFSENEKVRLHKRFWKRNRMIDRYHRMSLMVDILSGPKAYLKAGLVTEAELASVPLTLRRWALWPYRLASICIIQMVVWEVWRRWCDIPIP